jgi:hypothetical protein
MLDAEQESLLDDGLSAMAGSDSRSLSDAEQASLFSANSSALSTSAATHNELETGGPNTHAAQAAKAIDMAGGDSWQPTTPSRPASLATTNSNLYHPESQTPLDDGPAPPDYAQATAQQAPVQPRYADEESLYSTASDLASVDWYHYLRKTRRWKILVKRHWKSFSLLTLCICCILLTGILIIQSKTHQEVEAKLGLFFPDYPRKSHGRPKDFHQSTANCRFDSYHDFLRFGWIDPEAFAFVETLRELDFPDFGSVSISGNVEVRPAPYGQKSPIEVAISFATTGTWHDIPAYVVMTSDGLHIYPPSAADDSNSYAKHTDLKRHTAKEDVCLDVWVGIYVKTQLDSFSITTENLHVDIGHPYSLNRESWSFRIRNESHIHTRRGNVTTSYWDSRDAYIASESGSIKGTYGLHNNLKLETESGDIKVDIRQQASPFQGYLDTHPPNTPSNLSTRTDSGKQFLRLTQDLVELISSERKGFVRTQLDIAILCLNRHETSGPPFPRPYVIRLVANGNPIDRIRSEF